MFKNLEIQNSGSGRVPCGCSARMIATLFEKRMNDKVRLNSDFVGFSIPDEFVAGFCLDEDQKYRDCKHLVVIKR